MKRSQSTLILGPWLCSLALGLGSLAAARAQSLVVPGATGADGNFAPAGNITIDLSKAATGAWDSDPPVVGAGVYDPEKWAVVFKYSSVNIPQNVTVTFKNNASHAPVVWLVSGNVTINGTVDLSAKGVEPGPGGFRGGLPVSGTFPAGAGHGPGGGENDRSGGNPGSASSMTAGIPSEAGRVGLIYGQVHNLFLVGGSGGAGYAGNISGAGGGAILIAAKENLEISGSILAKGGDGIAAGSGGNIRLASSKMTGSGRVRSSGGIWDGNRLGGEGNTRLETSQMEANYSIVPTAISVLPANPLMIWPPASAPHVTIVSVRSSLVPADPKASTTTASDVLLEGFGPSDILIQGLNVPTNWVVKLRLAPNQGSAWTVNADLKNGDATSSTWLVRVNLPTGHTAMQVHAIAP